MLCFSFKGQGGRGFGERSGGFGREQRGGDHDRRDRKFDEFKEPDPGMDIVQLIFR